MVIGEVNDYLKIFVLMINFIVNRLKTKKKHIIIPGSLDSDWVVFCHYSNLCTFSMVNSELRIYSKWLHIVCLRCLITDCQ